MLIETALDRLRPTLRLIRPLQERSSAPLSDAERLERRRRISVIAVVSYLPLFLTRPGSVVFDSADGPFVDPVRAMRLAASRWNPTAGLGTVADRALDDGFPMTPWLWFAHLVHLPTWIAQRLWLGSLLFAAGLGVCALMRALRWIGPGRLTAAVAYIVSPYLLSGIGGRSVIFLAWAALPWLIADTIRSLETTDFRAPARFAVVVALVGRSHLPSLLYAMVGPILWIVVAVAITREVPGRAAIRSIARILTMSLATCAWWILAFASDPVTSLADLTAGDGLDAARQLPAIDVIRGVVDPAATGSVSSNGLLTALGFVIPALSLTALCKLRFRNRLYIVALIVVGMVLATGAGPSENPEPYARLLQQISGRSIGALVAPTARAVPLVTLGVAIGFAAAARALTQFRRARPLLVEGAAVAMALLAMPSMLLGELLDAGFRHTRPVPIYWRQLAEYLAPGDDSFNVLELPGLSGTTYNWGRTNEPISSSLLRRPTALRTTERPSETGTFDLVASIDDHLRAGTLEPTAIAPLARMMGVDSIVVRNDQPGDAELALRTIELLRAAPGVTEEASFGPLGGDPPLMLFVIDDPLPRIRFVSKSDLVVVAGSGSGLVDLANAGLLTGREVVAYAAAFESVEAFNEILGPQARFIVTDSNRWESRVVAKLDDAISATGNPNWPSADPPGSYRSSPVADARPESFSTVDFAGADSIIAPYVNGVSSTLPTDRVALAFDGDRTTAWKFAAPTAMSTPRFTVRYDAAVTTGRIELEGLPGVPLATDVALTFDGFDRVTPVAVSADGALFFEFDRRSFRTLAVEVLGSETARPGETVAIAEIVVTGNPIVESLVVPTDHVRLTPAVAAGPLTFSFTRWRNATSGDPETHLSRVFEVPATRRFSVLGSVAPQAGLEPTRQCRDDLVWIDEEPLLVRIAPSDAALSGYELKDCGQGVELVAGRHTIRTAPRSRSVITVDQLTLSSEPTAGSPIGAVAPSIEIVDPSQTSFVGTIDDADGEFWLLNGMSADSGWSAQIDQVSLDHAVLANGFATAWPVKIDDDNEHRVFIRMASQRPINIAVMFSSVLFVVAAGIGLRSQSRRRPTGQQPIQPDSLRTINSTYVVLAAVALFSLAAGPIPGVIAGLAALSMEHRASLRRTISWAPLPIILGLGAVRGLHETFTGDTASSLWGPGGEWSNGMIWVALAFAVTTALINSERRPPSQIVV